MSSRVSERGQITINRTIRKQLRVEPGMIAHQRVVDGRLEVLFLPAPHRQSLAGALYREGQEAKVLTRDDIEQAVMQAVAEELEPGENRGA